MLARSLLGGGDGGAPGNDKGLGIGFFRSRLGGGLGGGGLLGFLAGDSGQGLVTAVVLKKVEGNSHVPSSLFVAHVGPTVDRVGDGFGANVARKVGGTMGPADEGGLGGCLVVVLGEASIGLVGTTTVVNGPGGVHFVGGHVIESGGVLGPFPLVVANGDDGIGLPVDPNDWELVGRGVAHPVVEVWESNDGGQTGQKGGRPGILAHGPGEHATIRDSKRVDVVDVHCDIARRNEAKRTAKRTARNGSEKTNEPTNKGEPSSNLVCCDLVVFWYLPQR